MLFLWLVCEIKSGSVQSVCVLFLWLVCDAELYLNILLRLKMPPNVVLNFFIFCESHDERIAVSETDRG